MKTKFTHMVIVFTAMLLALNGCDNTPKEKIASSDDPVVSNTLSSAQDEFKGKIGKTFEESVEDWPEEHVFTGKEPNVLLILLDDTGFAHLGSFGGLTETPNIDKLAAGGLRYNNFHTTALCSPSRAAILAGRNHHSIGLGSHALSAMGFPGYSGRVPMTAQEVTKTAQHHGWGTYAIGKWTTRRATTSTRQGLTPTGPRTTVSTIPTSSWRRMPTTLRR